MPPKLPGLCWDEQRNRYFAESSTPGAFAPTRTPSNSNTSITVPPEAVRRESQVHNRTFRRQLQHGGIWGLMEMQRSAPSQFNARINTANHHILLEQYAATNSLTHTIVPAFGTIKSFGSTIVNGRCRQFIGDSHGWLYTSTTNPTLYRDARSNETGDWNAEHSWSTELNLQFDSEVSSICLSGNNCVATCFGNTARLCFLDLNTPERTSLFKLNSVHDVRHAHLDGTAIMLGAKMKAIHLSDVSVFPSVRVLDTQSDVFSVFQKGNLAYTGARNGSTRRFDLRIGKPEGQLLFAPKHQKYSPVLHLSAIRDWELLCSWMDGNLATYDIRFLSLKEPMHRFEGHVNNITQKLGLAVDPTEEFLFAAGEDRRIRCWSLRSGNLTHSNLPSPPLGSTLNPQSTLDTSPQLLRHTLPSQAPTTGLMKVFETTFEQPVEVLHVGPTPIPACVPTSTDSDERTWEIRHGNEMSLWAATGRALLQYHLGKKSGLRMCE